MEQDKRPLFAGRIVASFIIATVIFSLGFLCSYMLIYYKYSSITNVQDQTRYDFLRLQLERELIPSYCGSIDLSSLSEELDRMGGMIGILEERFGKYDSKVVEQKKRYTLLEIQHFFLIKDYMNYCNKTIPTILFFYSNSEEFSDQAERMGYILSSLKTKHPGIMVYSFDYDLDDRTIKMLIKGYKINSPNSVVVNEGLVISDINNIDDAESLILNQTNSGPEVIVLK